jgi:hypothetical protein
VNSASFNSSNVFRNLDVLETILNVFSIEDVGRRWNVVQDKLTASCASDMVQYLSGLQQRRIWAIKSKWSAFYFFLFYFLCLAEK